MFALPVSELYERFGKLIKTLEKVLDEYIEQKKEEIRGPAGAIDNVTASVNSNAGTPKVTVSLSGTPERRKIDLKFENLKGDIGPQGIKGETGNTGPKGDKPIKGVDYLTEEEKQQFAIETSKIVANEGNKQITLVGAEAAKVIEQLKSLIAGNPATTNAQTLSGKTRVEFEKDTQALAGKYNGNFPLTSTVKGGVYLDTSTSKFYICNEDFNNENLETPDSRFEELSVCNNLEKIELLTEYTDFLDITSFEMKKPSGSSIVTSNIHLLSKPFYALNFIGSYIESLNENRFKVELVTSFYENSGGFGESGFSKKAEITKEISETTNKWIRFCIKLDKEYDDISAVKKELNRELQTNIKLYRERDSFSNYIQNKFETVHSGKVLKINSDGTVSPKNAYLNGNGFMQNKGGYAYADPFDVDKFINTSDRDTFFVSVKTLKNALHYADSAFGMSPTGNINSMFIKDKATHKNYAYELHNKEFILKNVQKYLPDVRTDRVLVWNEEFSGDKIDTDIWKIEDKVPNNSELSVIENVSVMDSICTLTSKYGEVEHKGKRYNRTGASISTKNSVLFNKGLIEAKIRVSSNGGEWTGFWLMGDAQWSFCGEIDISEYYQAYNKSEATLHFFNSSNQDDKTPSSIIPVNNVREWNIYGCEIKENEVNIFVNNQLVKKFDTSTLDLAKVFSSDERGFNPFNFLDKFIILTLGSTSTSSKSTNTLEIDWIRLYAPEEETELDYTSYYITCPCDTDTVNHQSEITVNLSETIKLYGYSCFPAWCVSDKNNDIKYVRFTSNNESVIKPNGRDATMVIYGRGKCNITATDNKGNKVTRAFNVI